MIPYDTGALGPRQGLGFLYLTFSGLGLRVWGFRGFTGKGFHLSGLKLLRSDKAKGRV